MVPLPLNILTPTPAPDRGGPVAPQRKNLIPFLFLVVVDGLGSNAVAMTRSSSSVDRPNKIVAKWHMERDASARQLVGVLRHTERADAEFAHVDGRMWHNLEDQFFDYIYLYTYLYLCIFIYIYIYVLYLYISSFSLTR